MKKKIRNNEANQVATTMSWIYDQYSIGLLLIHFLCMILNPCCWPLNNGKQKQRHDVTIALWLIKFVRQLDTGAV